MYKDDLSAAAVQRKIEDGIDYWERLLCRADFLAAMRHMRDSSQIALDSPDRVIHASDCAVHNMPAEPNGACDCVQWRLKAVHGGR